MSKKIVVAIDLGTSRSAYAYSIQGRAEGDIIIKVPKGSLPSVSTMKTDTAVLLRNTNFHDVVAFGRAAGERFIEECEDDDASIEQGIGASSLFRRFKTTLCERHDYESIDCPVATAEVGQQLPLIVVMTAVLRHFKNDVIAHLCSVSEVAQTISDVTWVVTIPTIYDDFAVSSNDAPHLARDGTKIMILDCGGGTVDITSHEVLCP